jgi:hypothetical protein
VSNNDGSHHFSVSAAEHLAAVKAYRQKKLIEKENPSAQESNGKNEKP